MRYTVTKNIIEIIGTLWVGSTAATTRTLSAYDMTNLGDPNSREDVETWLALNAGDFSRILDFRADFTVGDRDIVHEWKSEESELTYNDCMFSSEED